MPFLSGKQAFLQILKDEGVDTMFGNPGTTELPLMDGLVREPSIRYILALQEAVAISMADGYAQASGKLGVVNVHTSPGLGNAMGMLYDAYEAGTPLLVTAGQHDQAMNLTEPILWSDLPPVARPYVKWSHEITRLEDLPRAVRRAVKTAMAHPTGPVFISLPVDVLNAERELDLLQSTRVAPRIRGDRAAIEAAADLLVKATRPILISGDAVAHGDALAEMVQLAEVLGAPVYTECVPSTCSFPFTHPLYHGPFPRLGQPIRQLLMQHDLLFSVGGVFSIYEGIEKLQHPHPLDVPWLPMLVLSIAIVLESFSLRTALRESRSERRGKSILKFVRSTKIPELAVVVLEDIVDHTNVGAIFRSAAALGVDAVLLAPRCADPLYRRSVKVAMGAVFTVPWTRLDGWYDALPAVSAAGFTTVALTLADDATDIEQAVADLDQVALVLGTEGHGLSPRWEQTADRRAVIPMREGIDSLNVAAATAVAAYVTMKRPAGAG